MSVEGNARVVSMPDHPGHLEAIHEEVGRALLDGALFVLRVTETRIDSRQTLEGGAQKENAPATQAHKQKVRGHTVPLRLNDHLLGSPIPGVPGPGRRQKDGSRGPGSPGEPVTDASLYRVNGFPVHRGVGLNSRQLGVPLPKDWRVVIEPPADRVPILPRLHALGYRYPFGIGKDAADWIPKRINQAFEIANRRFKSLDMLRSELQARGALPPRRR